MDRFDNSMLTIVNAAMLLVLAVLIFGFDVLFWFALAATPVVIFLLVWLSAGGHPITSPEE